MRIDNQPAFLLHSRPYRDSSLLIDCVTTDFGRVSGVVKGVRGTGKTARLRRSLMQAFVPLSISWSGRSDLKSILHFEAIAPALLLQGERLFSAMYINELYTRLLQPYDENPHWFDLYQQALQVLQQTPLIDVGLRQFELRLLDALGYGLDLTATGPDSEPLMPDRQYCYDAELGFVSADTATENSSLPPVSVFLGADLLAIASNDFNISARRAAKRLCRLALAVHLGDKPLKSRELFSRLPDL